MDKPWGSVAAELGSRVRAARHRLGEEIGERVSQERLAEMTGLHRTYIGHVERGEVNVALFNIVRLAAALEVDVAELVQGLRPPARRKRITRTPRARA